MHYWFSHFQLFIQINLQSKHYKLSHSPVSLSLPYLDLTRPTLTVFHYLQALCAQGKVLAGILTPQATGCITARSLMWHALPHACVTVDWVEVTVLWILCPSLREILLGKIEIVIMARICGSKNFCIVWRILNCILLAWDGWMVLSVSHCVS